MNQSGIAPGHFSSIRNMPSSSIDVPYASDLRLRSVSLQKMLQSKVTLNSEPPSAAAAPARFTWEYHADPECGAFCRSRQEKNT